MAVDEHASTDLYPWTLWQRTIMLLTSFFVSTMMSGITVGHLAFRELLLASRPDLLCTHQYLFRRDTLCWSREISLNGWFFLSGVITKLATLPVGMAVDRWGPRFTTMFGCAIFALGFGMLAVSRLRLDDWLHFGGYSTVAVGGVFVFIPSLQLCRIIPTLSSLMTAVMTSAFDVSAIVFFIMGKLYEVGGGRVSVNVLLGGYISVAVIAFLLVTSFYPDGALVETAIAAKRQKNSSRQQSQQPGNYTPVAMGKANTGIFSSSQSDTGKIEDEDQFQVWSILKNPEFWLMTFFTGIVTTRFSVFLANLHLRMAQSSLEWRFQRVVITGFLTFFPLGGFISLPTVGQLLQSLSLATNTLLVWLLIIVLWGHVEFILTTDVIGASVILAAILRPYYYSVTNQACERLFGGRHYGKIYGMMLAGSGLINLLALPAIYDGRWGYVGWIASLPSIVRYAANFGFVLPIYLYYQRL